jgi:4-diphosphocytidyl-2-C-methyl-D-erythritol kinase
VLESVTVRAPAKVNLYLAVGDTRPDGFHELTTVYQAIALYDEVTVRPGDSLTVSVTGSQADEVPRDSSNLAAVAVQVLAERHGRETDVAISIRKGIPVAGGCAGGSADAAAALVAVDHLWGLGLSRSELTEVAAELGSDVPFSLAGGTALGTGRGEQLTPVLGAGIYTWVLALAEGGLSTPAVYGELDRLRAGGSAKVSADASSVLSALRAGSSEVLGQALANDLQDAALSLRPELGDLLAFGAEVGAVGGVVSGSGPTVAFLALDDSHAAELADAVAEHSACRSVVVADGPVTGARVTRAS